VRWGLGTDNQEVELTARNSQEGDKIIEIGSPKFFSHFLINFP
jgi:hypothetical protein